jgi:outer membrane protein assembly factor BamA
MVVYAMTAVRRAAYGALGAFLVSGGTALAEPPTQPIEDISDQVDATRDKGADPNKKSLLVVPIPQSSPTLGTGLTLGAGYFYNPNGSKEPWITAVGAMATSNGSRALGALQKMTLADDSIRITAFAGLADVNLKYYGQGAFAAERDLFIELNEDGWATMLQGQKEVSKNLFAGLKFVYLDVTTSIHRDEPLFPDAEIPRAEFDAQLSMIGPILSYDLRDNTLNTQNGLLLSASLMFADDGAIGSDFNYDKLVAAANVYRQVRPGTVLAGRASLCRVSGGAPFFDMCMFGASSDLRGYDSGKFRDDASWATQVEVRQHLFGKFGVVGFAGIGGTASELTNFDEMEILQSLGVGLRFMPVKAANTNVRIDYAWGEDGGALYISVGEAF